MSRSACFESLMLLLSDKQRKQQIPNFGEFYFLSVYPEFVCFEQRLSKKEPFDLFWPLPSQIRRKNTDCGQHQWWSTLQRIDCKNRWRLHLAINGPCPKLDKRPCTKFQKIKVFLNNGVVVQKNSWELYFDCYCARLQKMVKVIVMCNKPSVWDESTQAEACGLCSKVCSLCWQFLDFQCFSKHSEHTADPIQKHADYMNSNPILTYSSFVVLLKWLWE